MSNEYFKWIAGCCKELGWDIRDGEKLVEDVNWFGCYDDGMTPKEAVNEAVSNGVVQRKATMEIKFYKQGDEYGFMSNFANYPIEIDGKVWPTSEHYYQAQKFAGTQYEEAIRLVASPGMAARMGRDRNSPLRSDWELIKDDIMRKAIWEKFNQHEGLRDQLLATGDAILIESTKNDRYWADGGDGKGKNMLGVLLMELRAKLRDSLPSDNGATKLKFTSKEIKMEGFKFPPSNDKFPSLNFEYKEECMDDREYSNLCEAVACLSVALAAMDDEHNEGLLNPKKIAKDQVQRAYLLIEKMVIKKANYDNQ